jgi:hypothetical protein
LRRFWVTASALAGLGRGRTRHAEHRPGCRKRSSLRQRAHHGAVFVDAVLHPDRPEPPLEWDGPHQGAGHRLSGLRRADAIRERDAARDAGPQTATTPSALASGTCRRRRTIPPPARFTVGPWAGGSNASTARQPRLPTPSVSKVRRGGTHSAEGRPDLRGRGHEAAGRDALQRRGSPAGRRELVENQSRRARRRSLRRR